MPATSVMEIMSQYSRANYEKYTGTLFKMSIMKNERSEGERRHIYELVLRGNCTVQESVLFVRK